MAEQQVQRTSQTDRTQEEASLAIAKAQAEAAKINATETVPGGRYVTEDGRVVDANGKEVKAKD